MSKPGIVRPGKKAEKRKFEASGDEDSEPAVKKRKSSAEGNVEHTKSRELGKTKLQYVCSWDGLEQQKKKIREAAIEIRDSDALLRSLVSSVQATGHISLAIRDISKAATPEVARAAKAHLAMRELIAEFRDVYRLDVSFMQCEVALILDPSEHIRSQSEKILNLTRKRNGYALSDDSKS